jgi:hypothetical protein
MITYYGGADMRLIKEEIRGWSVYQFLVDDKNMKYIKYITAIDGGGLWDFMFREDETVEEIANVFPTDDRHLAMSIKSMFKDNENWVVAE